MYQISTSKYFLFIQFLQEFLALCPCYSISVQGTPLPMPPVPIILCVIRPFCNDFYSYFYWSMSSKMPKQCVKLILFLKVSCNAAVVVSFSTLVLVQWAAHCKCIFSIEKGLIWPFIMLRTSEHVTRPTRLFIGDSEVACLCKSTCC
ncbi:hypothetical protein FKM82_001516 [Ascaphus truei]